MRRKLLGSIIAIVSIIVIVLIAWNTMNLPSNSHPVDKNTVIHFTFDSGEPRLSLV